MYFFCCCADSNFRCENRDILVKLEYFHCVNQAQELSVQQPCFRHKVKHALLYIQITFIYITHNKLEILSEHTSAFPIWSEF